MRTATVVRGFLRGNDEMRPGQTFECDDNEYRKWLALGFVAGYETKVNVEKKRPLESSQAGPVSRRPTRKRSKKPAGKPS